MIRKPADRRSRGEADYFVTETTGYKALILTWFNGYALTRVAGADPTVRAPAT